jgi:predicted PurR-regulated permease PerM
MPSGWQLERWQQRAYRVWTIVGVLLLLAVAGYVLARISGALIPFVMAFVLTFILAWPVRLLEARGLGRGLAAALTIVGLLVFVGLVFTFVLPILGRQLAQLAVRAPLYVARAEKQIEVVQSSIRAIVLPAWASRFVANAFAQLAAGIASLGQRVAESLLAAGSQALTLFFDAFISLVITFWALRDLPTIREEVLLVSGKWREDVELLFSEIAKSMGGYIRGQTVASLCTGAMAMIGLAIVHVPYAFLLGALAFVLNYIPYVGPFLTALVAALVGLFVSPLTGLLGVVVVIVAQQVTDNLITPRVMSSEVNLHPTLIIFSLLVGATLFGIPGMLFAIPIAAAVQGAFVYYFERATKSQLATADGALFRTEEDEDEAEACADTNGGSGAQGDSETGSTTHTAVPKDGEPNQ